QAGASSTLALLDIVRVKLHPPEAFESKHVLQPQERRGHGFEVGGNMIEVRNAHRMVRVLRRCLNRHSWVKPIALAALDEAKRGITKRGGNDERSETRRTVLIGFDVVHWGAAACLQQVECVFDVLHPENNATHTVG